LLSRLAPAGRETPAQSSAVLAQSSAVLAQSSAVLAQSSAVLAQEMLERVTGSARVS
jgi:hypothetical protein